MTAENRPPGRSTLDPRPSTLALTFTLTFTAAPHALDPPRPLHRPRLHRL
jgi:hypothetical protein